MAVKYIIYGYDPLLQRTRTVPMLGYFDDGWRYDNGNYVTDLVLRFDIFNPTIHNHYYSAKEGKVYYNDDEIQPIHKRELSLLKLIGMTEGIDYDVI